MAKKATDAEMILRVSEVRQLLLGGYTRSHILRVIGDKWGIATRAIDGLIHDATEEIAELNRVGSEMHLALLTSNLWDLYRHSMGMAQLDSARQALMSIAKIRGLDKGEVTLNIKREHKDASDEELLSALGLTGDE